MLEIPPYIKDSLQLNSKDIAVYLDLLQFGESAVSTIAARTSIDRTTTYAVLKRLVKKGVVVRTEKKETKYFMALDPEVLADKLKHEIENKEMKLRAVLKFIPQLKAIKNQESSRPAIQIFEGGEGIISLYELLLKTNKKQDAFLTVERIPANLKDYLTKDYIRNKKKLEVNSRVLVEDSKRARHYKNLDRNANRETKLIPKGKFPFETEIIIGEKNEIAIIDFQKELIGVLIKSKSIRNTMSSIFDLIWTNN